VAKKPQKRIKHVPQRTCIGCKTVLAKRELVRLVHTPEGIMVDETGKAAGRGAYVHNTRRCWEQALKGPISHALRTDITPADQQRLKEYLERLPEVDPIENRAESRDVTN